MKDDKLWRVFSLWIRLRDADKNGYIRCITSGKMAHWTESDAGHFISRRHLSTKFDEQNVHAQNRHDNRFQYGKQYEYGLAIDKKYGAGTAEKILARSRQTCKRGKSDIDFMIEHYGKHAVAIANEKGIDISNVALLKKWNKK